MGWECYYTTVKLLTLAPVEGIIPMQTTLSHDSHERVETYREPSSIVLGACSTVQYLVTYVTLKELTHLNSFIE